MATVGTRQDHRDSFAAKARVGFVANRSLRLAGCCHPQFRPRRGLLSFSQGRICGTPARFQHFALVNRETTMPFSLPSYLLGVGTVVGALAFGFGGGVLLTKSAMKDTPVAETRVERVKRADSPSAAPQPVETVETKGTPASPQPAEPAPPATGPAPPVQASTEPPKTEPPKPFAEAPKPAEPVRAVELPRQTEPATPAEQKEAELRKAEERKFARQKRDAERKAKAIALARAKQRQFEEQGEPSRPEYVFERSSRRALAFEREEPRSNQFDIPLFGRSREFSPSDRED
jgi:hypothetical protein